MIDKIKLFSEVFKGPGFSITNYYGEEKEEFSVFIITEEGILDHSVERVKSINSKQPFILGTRRNKEKVGINYRENIDLKDFKF